MSYAQRKANWAYGITNYLDSKGFDVSGRGQKQNKIVVEFLKSIGEPYVRWNYNYKGLNDALQVNSEAVQQRFKEFKLFIDHKLKKDGHS